MSSSSAPPSVASRMEEGTSTCSATGEIEEDLVVVGTARPGPCLLHFDERRPHHLDVGAQLLQLHVDVCGSSRFIGMDNYNQLASAGPLWLSLGRTFIFMVLAVAIQTVLGAVVGYLFWKSNKVPGRRLALTLLFTPDDLDSLVLGSLLALDARPGFWGYQLLRWNSSAWKRSTSPPMPLAFPAVLVVDSWMWIPFMALMTLAALGSVPKAELVAAQVDNLSFWQRLIHVIIPAGKFIIILGILLRTIDVFKTMDLVYLMTNGGPGDRTELIAVASTAWPSRASTLLVGAGGAAAVHRNRADVHLPLRAQSAVPTEAENA